MSDIGRKANFVLKRPEENGQRVKAFTGILIGETDTHYKVKCDKGFEIDLLKTDVLQVEWHSISGGESDG